MTDATNDESKKFGPVPAWLRLSLSYGEALLVALLATGIRYLLQGELHSRHPFALAYAAIAYTVWRHGVGPAVFAAVCAFFAADYLFIEPVGSVIVGSVLQSAPFYVITVSIIIGIAHALRRSNLNNLRLAEQSSRSVAERESQDHQLRLALEAGQMGSWEWDLRTNTVVWSPELEALHGYGPGEFDRTFEAYRNEIHPGDVGRVIETIQQELEEGDSHHIEYRIVRRDQSIRWVEGRGRIERDEHGNPVKLRGICADVTDRKMAENAIRDRELRYRLILEGAGAAIWDWDIPGRRVVYSSSWKALRGYDEHEISDREEEWSSRIHPEDFDRVMQALQDHFDGKTPFFVEEYRIQHKDGHYLWIQDRGVAVRDSDGEVIRMAGSELDITESKVRERATSQRASEQSVLFEFTDRLYKSESLEDVFDAALLAIHNALRCDRSSILLFDESQTMKFVAWRGLPESYRIAVEGHSPWSIDDPGPRPFGIDDVEASDLSDELKAVILREDIRALGFVPLLVNRQLIGKFMVYFDAPHAFSDPEMELALTIGHQIAFAVARTRAESERLRTSRALEESEKRYRQLVQLLPVALFSCDAKGRITFYNDHAARLWGRKPALDDDAERYCGAFRIFRPDGTSVHNEDCPMAIAVQEGKRFRDEEMVIERPDGTRINALVSIDPIVDEQGNLIGAINVFHDVTQLKQIQSQLEEADRRKDEFLATLAHELRNPLAPIRSGLDYITRRAYGDHALNHAHEVISRQADHLSRLVDDLFDISRINRGEINLRREIQDIRPLLEAAVDMVLPSAEAAHQTVSLELPDEPLMVDCDPHRVTQVMGNLLINAYKFTNDGGRITLRAQREGDEAVITVTDNGRGMSKEALDRVFELFAQAGNQANHRPVGLGVGLALAKQIVVKHGGALQASSDGPEQGSSFTVRLPLVCHAPLEASEAQTSNGVMHERRRILVVDDNRDAADSMALLLELDDHETRVAYSGAEALEACKTFRPEVVLLDLGMPEMDGFAVAARLQEQAETGKPVLVALTGWGQDSDVVRTREAGFDGHLVKPVGLEEMRQVLHGIPHRSNQASMV